MKYTATAFVCLFQSCAVFAQSSLIEDQSLRCASMAFIHTSLSQENPDFGQAMADIGEFYAMVYGTQRSFRTSVEVSQGDILKSRDATAEALGKVWLTNPDAVITEAAVCNMWRDNIADSFAFNGGDLSEGLSPAFILQAVKDPPTRASVEEVERWRDITSLAFETWIDAGNPTPSSMKESLRESLKQ
jgi:hypothetical protein